ncbi:T9SS type A sorting domain-containing protein [Aestuariibaculum sediminum]|uniref:T9SS type A sorting domain-containing protein n=1 Tax=Aestuariibaculum sediminum TaxID=2770637 RepID=A0A8J6U6Y4_9FLAO|nr:T9SS type A sorting domain-containing protein [Aestuariibaculum sediminum]MBD0831178.1 T9SS type A sorting domain-containing protein [Aestuariibaculum sediminum]
MNTLSVNDQEAIVNSVKVFPNPTTSGEVELVGIKDMSQLVVEIYNLNGQLLKTLQTTNFNIEELSSGIYIARIKTEFGTINKRIIKQ